MKNLIYYSVLHNPEYIDLLQISLLSLINKNFIDLNETDLLIITTNSLKIKIQEIEQKINIKFNYFIVNEADLGDNYKLLYAGAGRLLIFKYNNIDNYNKILYLDTDTIFINHSNTLFDLKLENKLYAHGLNTISSEHHGAQFFNFNEYDKNTESFGSGVLLFNNCSEIKNLFLKTYNHICEHVKNNNSSPECLEQPFLVYHTIVSDLKDGELIRNKISHEPHAMFENATIIHFLGGPGLYNYKKIRMSNYL